MPAVVCPLCAAKINAPEKAKGKTISCPKCRHRFTVLWSDVPNDFANEIEEFDWRINPPPHHKPSKKPLVFTGRDYGGASYMGRGLIIFSVVLFIIVIAGLILEAAIDAINESVLGFVLLRTIHDRIFLAIEFVIIFMVFLTGCIVCKLEAIYQSLQSPLSSLPARDLNWPPPDQPKVPTGRIVTPPKKRP